MSCTPNLPIDIFYVIIDQLSDHKTLSACSLTSSMLRRMAQQRIFHNITVTVGNISSRRANDMLELTRLLTSNLHIARSIHHLTVRILEDFDGASSISRWPSSRTLLSAFPNVQKLHVVDVSLSRYRGWWDMVGEFPDALRSLVQQNSVTVLQLGAPGLEHEFEWPTQERSPELKEEEEEFEWPKQERSHYKLCPKRLSSFSTNDTSAGLRVLRAALFRDRPDNINTIQGILFRSATTLTHVWLAFPAHSLPCLGSLDRAALSLHDLVNLKNLTLSFNSETLIRPVLRILDTIPLEAQGVLDLMLRMRRSTLSLSMARDRWVELDHQLTEMLDRRILRTAKLEIVVFEMEGNTSEGTVHILTEALKGMFRRQCLMFR